MSQGVSVGNTGGTDGVVAIHDEQTERKQSRAGVVGSGVEIGGDDYRGIVVLDNFVAVIGTSAPVVLVVIGAVV